MSTQDEAKALKKLHARLVDTHNGYTTGIEEAERPAIVEFFGKFKAMREVHIGELDSYLRGKGLKPEEDGSWMTYVHTGIMKFRSAIGTLDRDIKDDVIEGEQKMLDLYDETLAEIEVLTDARELVQQQKSAVEAEIAHARSEANTAAA